MDVRVGLQKLTAEELVLLVRLLSSRKRNKLLITQVTAKVNLKEIVLVETANRQRWGLRHFSILKHFSLFEKWAWKLLSRVRLFVTPWTIWSMEFSRPEYWSGKPFPSPGGLPNSPIEPRPPPLQADSLPAEPQGKPYILSDSASITSLKWHSCRSGCQGQGQGGGRGSGCGSEGQLKDPRGECEWPLSWLVAETQNEHIWETV